MKVLIISFSDLARDPRVSRQIQWLQGHSVTTVGLGAPRSRVERHFNLNLATPRTLVKKIMRGFLLLFRRYQKYYWTNELVKQLKELLENTLADPFDVIIVNDLDPLPIAHAYRRGGKILLDAHEYSPEEFTDRFLWRLLIKNYVVWLCRTYLKHVDSMVAVNSAIAQKYSRAFAIPLPKVVTNAPDFFDLKPTDVDSKRIRLIYHGVATPSRSLDKIIELSTYLDSRFEMDLILMPGDKCYIDSIKKLAEGNQKIRFLSPVAMKDIVPFTHQYDMGVYLLPPVNFNYLNGLPNKLFEFIQARLSIAIGPSPMMRNIIEHYQCGVVSQDFDPASLADKLNSLSAEEIKTMKENAHKAAKDLNAEANRLVFEQALNF